MCSFQARNEEILLSHICKIHRDDLNFLVSCSKCLRSFRLWDSYRKHAYRGCKTTVGHQIVPVNQSDEPTQDIEDLTDQPEQEDRLQASKFLPHY